jgi:hypothetical protein
MGETVGRHFISGGQALGHSPFFLLTQPHVKKTRKRAFCLPMLARGGVAMPILRRWRLGKRVPGNRDDDHRTAACSRPLAQVAPGAYKSRILGRLSTSKHGLAEVGATPGEGP